MEDILIISFDIVGEKINSHKTSAKIQKLKQNLSKEVVWVMKDDSFVNLIYFLSIENEFNNSFISLKDINLNNPLNMRKSFINNSLAFNPNKNGFVKVNTINKPEINNDNNNNESQKGRITKKIIKRKTDNSDVINGGIVNTENEKKLIKIKNNEITKENCTLIENKNSNNQNNLKHINYNLNNNNTNSNKKPFLTNSDQKDHKLLIDKQLLKQKENSNQKNYLAQKNLNNQNSKNSKNLNGKNKNINIKKNENVNVKNFNLKENKKNNNNVSNINNLNINLNEALYNSASPKKKPLQQNNSINKVDLSQISLINPSMLEGTAASSLLNNSDCVSISTNKNDKLNITLNTIDNNIQDTKYKILSNNNYIKDIDNIYSKDYISRLDSKEYEYDTFCQAIIKTGLSENKISLSKFSENFPAPCGHELCSKLPALEPNVLNFYQNLNKANIIDIKQAATSHLIFPLGIKLCIEQNYYNEELNTEPLINTIYNVKGDIYYIASLTYYRKITIKNYNKVFNINPIDVYNKFKKEEKEQKINKKLNSNINIDINNNINNNDEKDKNANKINNINNIPIITNMSVISQNNIDKNNSAKKKEENDKNNNSEENKEDLLKIGPNDIIYIPESLSLVSRFPYFNQLSKCLKIIINMRRQRVNGDNNHQISKNISLFINHLINQVPIGDNKLNLFFYTPISIDPIALYNPFLYNFGNFTCDNIFTILNIDNIITIFLLVLLEQKIIFVDRNHLILSAISFFFINLIYPLTWVNTYQPLLSLSTIRYVQSITPFIMGGNENLILYAFHKKYIIYNENYDNIDKSNIVFVSLSNNLISCDCYNLINNKKGQNRKQILKYLGMPDLPKSIEKKLYNHLGEIEKMDNLKAMNEKIKTFFCRIMVFILDDYKDHFLYSLEKPIFNRENYLMCKKDDKKMFYKELLGTQLFTQFIFCENEFYKNKKLCGKKLKTKKTTYGILHDGIYKDNTFFMKNKNKNEDLKIMIKKRRKEKIKKSFQSAKKIVKNIGQMFTGTTENKKNGKKERSVKKNITTNISIIKNNKKGGNKINNVLLMPYFIEVPNIKLTDMEKYDYIQNKLNAIITLDYQLNQINNYRNKYIFDFNQKFDLKLIKDDNTRYFIGLLEEEENENYLNLLNVSSMDNNSKLKKSTNSNRNSKKINGTKNQNDEEEKKFIQSKEKINTWFINIYLTSNKKKLSNNLEINDDIRNERNRKFFSKLISQNYRTLFDIRENNQNFLNNTSFMELLLKIQMILKLMTYNEFETCKLITLSCFKYFTILEEHKHTRFYLYNKYNDLYNPCSLWLDNIFWKTWFDEDISFVEKKLNLSDENDYNLDLNKSDDEDNQLYEYNEENDNCSIEYKLLMKIYNVMNSLQLGEEFIKKVIFNDLALNYLTEDEINLFKDEYE